MFEAWCAKLPGVTKIVDGLWALPQHAETSFPAGAHQTLAEIEEKSFWFNHRNRVIASVLRRFTPSGTVFDIGGGNGYVSLGLSAAGFECAVIEPGEGGARTAHQRGLPVLEAPFQCLNISDCSIPAAGLFDVLEHIEDDAAALTQLYRALKPNGRLYIAVPAHGALWSDEDMHAGHYRRYSAAGLDAALRKVGFAVEYTTYFFGVLLLPILLLRALPSRLGLRRRQDASGDHDLPRGLAGRFIAAALAREERAIARGGWRRMGASLIAVARKPD